MKSELEVSLAEPVRKEIIIVVKLFQMKESEELLKISQSLRLKESRKSI